MENFFVAGARRLLRKLRCWFGLRPTVWFDGHNININGTKLRLGTRNFKGTLRRDPCAYCYGPGGTLDHIQPKAALKIMGAPSPGITNLISACDRCNGRKGAMSLLTYIHFLHTNPIGWQ